MLSEKIDLIENEEKLRKHQAWITKLSTSLDKYSEHGIKDFILEGKPAPYSDSKKYIQFENESIMKLDMLLPEDKRKKIFSSCSCNYPVEKLLPIKQKFAETQDLQVAHTMLQAQFEKDVEDVPFKDQMIAMRWGLAGVLENDKIIITKIPKFPQDYFTTTDTDEKRYSYCHCGRVRKQIREHKQTYSEAYCYCGAGYYKNIWEQILDKEVKIDVVETVLKGSSVCKFVLIL